MMMMMTTMMLIMKVVVFMPLKMAVVMMNCQSESFR